MRDHSPAKRVIGFEMFNLLHKQPIERLGT